MRSLSAKMYLNVALAPDNNIPACSSMAPMLCATYDAFSQTQATTKNSTTTTDVWDSWAGMHERHTVWTEFRCRETCTAYYILHRILWILWSIAKIHTSNIYVMAFCSIYLLLFVHYKDVNLFHMPMTVPLAANPFQTYCMYFRSARATRHIHENQFRRV